MYPDSKSLRIVYMGTPDFALAPLRALVNGGYNIVAVVTMPDKPAGRGLKLQPSAVKKYADEAGLPVLQPAKLKSEEFRNELEMLSPDMGIVVAFKMLPEEIFSIPRYGTFNLHASLLPQYRGAAPINWALINGEELTGVTTFLLNARMDEGALIDCREVVIEAQDNAGTLHDKLMGVGAELVVASVDKLVSEGFRPHPQPSVPTNRLKPAPKIFKATCHIDFSASGRSIVNFIRGLSPYPGAWTNVVERSEAGEVIKESLLKIYAAGFEPAANVTEPAGTFFADTSCLRIACGDGYIIPVQLQPAGKPRMNARDYLNGLKPRGELRGE